MDCRPLALVQYDIVDHVLSHCLHPGHADPLRLDFPTLNENAWLAAAARNMQAWLEPALRHLYRSIRLSTTPWTAIHQVPFKSIGHRVRALHIFASQHNSAGYLKHLTNLTTLKVTLGSVTVPADILACPLLPSLTNLVISHTCPNSRVVVDLLRACKNLRRLRLCDWAHWALPEGKTPFDEAETPFEEVVRPERLEALVITYRWAPRGGYRAPLCMCSTLVILNIFNPGHTTAIRLLCRAIETSSRTLRAVSLVDEYQYSSPDAQGRDLVKALTSCALLRFLRLGIPIISTIPLLHLFELLAPLPIEFLAFRSYGEHFCSELIDSLPLLLPNLSVIMPEEMHRQKYVGTKSKVDYLLVERPAHGNFTWPWPPPYHELSPEARAIFEYRPYRETFFFHADLDFGLTSSIA
jgi:hypothetical protein